MGRDCTLEKPIGKVMIIDQLENVVELLATLPGKEYGHVFISTHDEVTPWVQLYSSTYESIKRKLQDLGISFELPELIAEDKVKKYQVLLRMVSSYEEYWREDELELLKSLLTLFTIASMIGSKIYCV